MLLQSTAKLPEGGQWTYEIKWDGYRAIAFKTGARATTMTSLCDRLVDSVGDRYSAIYDEAGETAEIAAAAEALYRVHREEHNSSPPPVKRGIERERPLANWRLDHPIVK